VAVVEVTDKARVRALLADDPMTFAEAIDENALGVEGIVSVFADDQPRPLNMVVVRWAQGSLGLRSVAHVRGSKLTGLEEVVAALPADRTQYDALLPFWAAPAVSSAFQSEVVGAEACYRVDQERLRPAPAVRQCVRVTDHDLLKPMFRKLADDVPGYALALRGALASVAAVTHLRDGIARVRVYTVEEARQRGFGRGVLTALSEELLALGIVPTATVDLGHEASVRMVERAGFHQTGAWLKARITGRRAAAEADPGLVQLGGAR
jgi:GNAT superfamily N-acetyltransferase